MPRAIQDAELTKSLTFGNTNFTANSNAIDLGQVTAFPINEAITAQIVTTAGTNAANNKNVNIRFQHSNVNTSANFTNIAELATLVIGEVSTGYAATTRNVSLPPGTLQFVRIQASGEANGGNANDGTASLKLLV